MANMAKQSPSIVQADYFYIVQQGSFSVSKAEGDGKEGTSTSARGATEVRAI